jgi:hypothetical protein
LGSEKEVKKELAHAKPRRREEEKIAGMDARYAYSNAFFYGFAPSPLRVSHQNRAATRPIGR